MIEDLDKESIASRLIKSNRKKPKAYPHWIDDNYQHKGEIVSEELTTGEEGLEVDLSEKPNKSIKAERYLDLIARGEKEHRAARLLGTTVRDMEKSPDIKVAVKKLIDEGTLPALVRKAMVRAGLDRIFMENLENKKGHKTAIAAAKLIGDDPDVGLSAPPQVGVGVNVDLSELGNLLANLQPIKGLEGFVQKEEIEDAEVDEERESTD